MFARSIEILDNPDSTNKDRAWASNRGMAVVVNTWTFDFHRTGPYTEGPRGTNRRCRTDEEMRDYRWLEEREIKGEQIWGMPCWKDPQEASRTFRIASLGRSFSFGSA
jgi:hypothetical protein